MVNFFSQVNLVLYPNTSFAILLYTKSRTRRSGIFQVQFDFCLGLPFAFLHDLYCSAHIYPSSFKLSALECQIN